MAGVDTGGETRRASGQSRQPRQRWQTRLAAILILLASLPIFASGLRFAIIELEAFGAQQAAKRTFVGRTLEEDEAARVRAQLVKAAAARPTRARLEWVSGAYASADANLTAIEEADAAAFLKTQLARNPASHPGWARLTRLEQRLSNKAASARYYKVAYETGAYLPSSALWAIAMGQRNWVYLEKPMQENVQQLTYDLFNFAPAATSTIAGPKWRELYMRAALAHEPEKIRLFERYLTLYFDPAYNR